MRSVAPAQGFLLALLLATPSLIDHAVAADAAPAPTPASAPAAAATVPPGRPRVGLALSGGGARGIAHVGVLKVLEELHVPIDCITGTSMGSIVGGTYASGTPAPKLEELVYAANWNDLFRDAPPRQELAMRRKADDYKTLFAPEFGVKDGSLALPKGVIAGVSIEAFFRQLALPAVGVTDFSKLPIPFEAMATDIETGDSVVLNTGSVAQAMRASMAVPGAIAPVEIDGRLLVDGGIANNLPIDQARKLCGDVIIAVNISTPPLKRKDITSALTVAAQLINFLGKQTVDDQLRRMTTKDVLIEPDLGDISAGSFERAKDAVRIGEEAARKLAPQLSRYSLSPEQFAAHRKSQVADRVASLGTVDEIRFEGLERTNPEVLRGLVETKPGETVVEEKIGADLRRIYGRGDFESIDYRIAGDPGGPRALVITPREKSWGGDYLRFGLGLETDFRSESAFNALAQYRKTWINQLGGEWLTEVQVGQDTHVYTELYQPLHEPGIWFANLHGSIGQLNRPVYDGDNKIANYLVGRGRIGVDLGANLGTYGTIRLGPEWTQVNARVETGDPVLPSQRENTSGVRAELVIDQLDNAWFARDGYVLLANYFGATSALGSAQNYQRFEASARLAKSWDANTLSLSVAGGTDFGTDMPAFESFALGGPLRLSGFRPNQFSGRDYAFARAMYYRRLVELPEILGTGLYGGASAEVGRMGGRIADLPSPGTLYSGSVYLGAATFAGPMYFGVGVGNGGAWSLYLLLGAP